MSSQSVISNDALKEQIKLLIGEHINDYIAEYVNSNEIKLKELSLIERVVRVEEELKALKILEQKRHEFLVAEMNTRFETIQKEMNIRFEAVNTRFDSFEKRFNFMQWLIASGFALIAILTTMK